MSDSAEDFLAAHDDPRPPTVCRDGDVVGDWRITAFLGRGGSGEVYRAEPCASAGGVPSPVALKVLVKDAATARERFVREAALLSRTSNPAFPRFVAKGETAGRPWMATELLELRVLPSADSSVADFMLKLCEGVAALHSMGYVHRDIKPGNILWRGDFPVLIDLGLAKDITRDFEAEGTSISMVDGHMAGVGTPGYAAPEQMTGDAVSPAADIHALGMLARECFNGTPPPSWERIIRRAVSSVPAYRYPNIAAFVSAVRHRHLRRNLSVAACAASVMCAALVWWAVGIRAPAPSDPPSEEQIAAAEKSAWEALCTDTTTNSVTIQTLGWTTVTNEMFGAPGSFIVMPRGRLYQTLTNKVQATIVNLGGRTNIFTRPISFNAGREYWIVGPGTLDAAISGPSNIEYHVAKPRILKRRLEFTRQVDVETGREYQVKNSILMPGWENDVCDNAPSNGVVHLVNCMVVNRTDVFWPASGLYYELGNGSRLLFPNLRESPDLFKSDYSAFDAAFSEIRFQQ